MSRTLEKALTRRSSSTTVAPVFSLAAVIVFNKALGLLAFSHIGANA
jgi:hypothetical protein